MTHLSPPQSSTPSTADSQSPLINKRQRSSIATSDDSSPTSKLKRRPSQPPPAALPPPIIPYPQQNPIPAHPHLVPFYPVYIPVPASNTASSSADSPRPPGLGSPPVVAQHPTAAGFYRPTTSSPTLYGQYPSPARPGTADEREQARRVSHSAIERRRRERINDKIIQLRQLIPSCADQEHLNKVTILQSAIDYISYLKKMAENKDGGALAESLKIDSLKIQSPRSMVPKEVAPFTTQFAVGPRHPPTPPPLSSEPEPPARAIKPKDIMGEKSNGPSLPLLEETGSANMSVDAMLCSK